MLIGLSIAAMVVVAVLGWVLHRHLDASRMKGLMDKRRSTSRLVGGAEFVDGSRHLAVALALTDTDFFYENDDVQASLDLRWVSEIEYDTHLATGHAVEGGKVLRIRCFSQVFEFVVPNEDLVGWHMMLPPRGRDATTVQLAPLVVAT